MNLLTPLIILTAYTFDFLNGFHDSANAISTVVSTHVLSPLQAVSLSAFFNFIAFLVFGVAVATTVGTGIVKVSAIDQYVIATCLMGAIFWDIFTWRVGLPISSSHALIGGLIGAAVAKVGFGTIVWQGLSKIVAFMVLSPIIGMVVSFLLMALIIRIFRKHHPDSINKHFNKLQILSSSLVNLSHGTNDAQKTMGIVTLLLLSSGYINKWYIPLWVVLAAHAAIASGTFFGGWRIVKTMGMKITKLHSVHGFAAESSAAFTIMGASVAGIPVSTTHVVSGSIMGVGAVEKLSAVRWGVARRIVWAWILTIPISAFVAFGAYKIIGGLLGIATV